MNANEVLNLVMSQNGMLTQEQYLDIYDNSPTLASVFLNEDEEYKFELVFNDKEEPILCNVTLGDEYEN